MGRYYFEVTDENYNDLGLLVSDDCSKLAAIGKVKKWMRENRVSRTILAIKSTKTNYLLEVIKIDITPTLQNSRRQPLSVHTQSTDSEQTKLSGPAGSKTMYVRSCYLGLPPSNPRRAISTISAEEYASLCKTRIGRFYLSLSDYRPCNLQCECE